MSQLVILSLGRGNFKDGFPNIILRLGKRGATWTQTLGKLPPAPEISQLYRNWRMLYDSLYTYGKRSGIEIDPTGITNISEGEFSDTGRELEEKINRWLGSEGFQSIEKQLRTRLQPSDRVLAVIESDDDDVWKMPWHLWHLFQDYPLAEMALSSPEYPPPVPQRPKQLGEKVNVLAIFGNSAGIDLEEDRKSLQRLSGGEVKWLVEPKREELNEQLWDVSWDVLFFAGHSQSEENARGGQLYINQNSSNNSLTIDDLKEALSQAVREGLQLAIFNSCDGLGLARDLAAAGIPLPPMVVMREPIPDLAAQRFLEYFLAALAGGETFHLAVRQAREKLKGLEGRLPGASWLPVICQHPAVEPLSWPQRGPKKQWFGSVAVLQRVPKRVGTLLLAGLASSLVLAPYAAVQTNELGLKSAGAGQFARARRYFLSAAFLDRNYPQPHYNLAMMCDRQLDDLDCAIEAYQQSMLRGFPAANAQYARLKMLRDRDLTAALKAVEEGFRLFESNADNSAWLSQHKPAKASLLKNRGWIRWQQKRLDEAERDLRSAIALEQDSSHSHCLLAQVLETKGQPKEALDAWRNTLKYAESRIPEQDDCIDLANQRLHPHTQKS